MFGDTTSDLGLNFGNTNQPEDKLQKYKNMKSQLEKELNQLEVNKQVAEKEIQRLEDALKSKLNVQSLDNLDEIKLKIDTEIKSLEAELENLTTLKKD